MNPPEKREGRPPRQETAFTMSYDGDAATLTDDPGICWWCGRHPRWRDPHHGDVPWSMCVHCYRAIVAGFRRRHAAALRLPPVVAS